MVMYYKLTIKANARGRMKRHRRRLSSVGCDRVFEHGLHCAIPIRITAAACELDAVCSDSYSLTWSLCRQDMPQLGKFGRKKCG